MEDAARFYVKKADEKSSILDRLDLEEGKYILATIHRAENTDSIENLKAILDSFDEISKKTKIILPIHPRTRRIIADNNLQSKAILIDPVGYFDMIKLIKNSGLIVTDSGGLQKEAFFFRKYCITVREQTEWIELVDNGYNFLSGTDKNLITENVTNLLDKEFPEPINLYGNGNAGQNICKALLSL